MTAKERGIVLINAERVLECRLVVAQAEFEHGQAILGKNVLYTTVGVGRLAGDRGRDPARVRLAPAPGQLVCLRGAGGPEDARVPGGGADLGSLGEAGPGRIETARPNLERALVVERYRQRGQCRMLPGQLNPADDQRVLSLVVEELGRCNIAEPEHAQAVLRAEIAGAQQSNGAPIQWHGSQVTGGRPRSEAVEQQVGRRGLRPASARRYAYYLRYLREDRPALGPAGIHRRLQRLQQRLAGTAPINRCEPPRRLQQDRCRLARLAHGKADRALQ